MIKHKLKKLRFKPSYRLRQKLLDFKQALAQEKEETIEMLVIYRKFIRRIATKEEMKIAHIQLKVQLQMFPWQKIKGHSSLLLLNH
jgi:hypothetical protein